MKGKIKKENQNLVKTDKMKSSSDLKKPGHIWGAELAEAGMADTLLQMFSQAETGCFCWTHISTIRQEMHRCTTSIWLPFSPRRVWIFQYGERHVCLKNWIHSVFSSGHGKIKLTPSMWIISSGVEIKKKINTSNLSSYQFDLFFLN